MCVGLDVVVGESWLLNIVVPFESPNWLTQLDRKWRLDSTVQCKQQDTMFLGSATL